MGPLRKAFGGSGTAKTQCAGKKKKEIALAAANAFFSLDKQHPKAQ